MIDEQHRFGVEQRATLRAKGADGDPDLLVMTATPIPRTAAMVIFGDLDLTTLDELPPGRIAVETVWAPSERHGAQAEAWDRVRQEVAAGHRAFVVCPLVSDSPRVEAKSATEEYERLAAEELAGLRVGLMHGQMAAAAHEETMDRFRSGGLEVLVATTVIEVGVDVPEATVMVVETRTASGSPSCTSYAAASGAVRTRAGASCSAVRRQRAAGGGGGLDGRVRAGRGGPAAAWRGDPARSPPEGAERPATGLAEPTRATSRCSPRPARWPRRSSARTPSCEAHPDLADEVELLLSEDEGEYLFKS